MAVSVTEKAAKEVKRIMEEQKLDTAAFLREHEAAVNKLVYDSVTSFGGSISAEHGVGQLKRDELAHYKSPVALALMRSIKQALDPRGLMNPGRVV